MKLVYPALAEEPDFRVRFAREVAAAQRVGGRWTAPVLDADTESSVPWVATGYVLGPALREVVDSLHGPLPEPTVRALARGLSEALRAIHAAGLIHRDLKPPNVMVTLDGPRVIDFGIAQAVDASVLTRTGSLVGSPGFMAPEQARAERLTTAADVFSPGAVLVHAATGVAPFSAGEVPAHVVIYRMLHEEPDLGSLSGPLRELAVRCLAEDPAARPTETGSGNEAEGLVIAAKQLDIVPFGIGVGANERGLRDAMQEAVQTLMDDGTYEEILTGHGLADCVLTEATVNAGR
ncbi:serine/threonine-protein kinase [Streptomyces johnsoniae]|uniref:serine/threonine-protein kinase n=1 Tax=Streptomyces johnsoniae TaxID=3075532 RepID=UPI00374DFC70